jgi:hypothetical protein
MVGFTPNRPFRTNFEPLNSLDADGATAVVEVTADYKLGFVEFDDQGWYWNTEQSHFVEKLVCAEAGIEPPHLAAPNGIILVAFVHGWKDNAAYDSDGVKAFRDILRQLSAAESAQTNHPARKVIGIYIGWRGLSAKWEPFKELSFWNRKETAHKVGGYGAMTRLLVDLENIQKRSLEALRADAPRTELIIIGHSFGGAAVYSALAQIITERSVDTLEKGKRLKPLGDQVILLNPAFEALRHYDMKHLAESVAQYPHDQRPVLSVFTSLGDWATHYAFPLGRFFSTLFQKNRNREQRQANLKTVGWFKPFVTHTLTYDATSSLPNGRISTFTSTTERHEYHTLNRLIESTKNIELQRSKWHPNAPTPQTYYFDDSTLKPIDGFKPGTPFLIVSVDRRIMRDHGDITNKVLINFIREYIQFCKIDPKDHSR